jgi:nitrite reductase/ring-hydroxylating ferredoxin subunit
VQGGALICHKHNWRFDLARGGACNKKGKSIHAVCVGNDPKLQW